VFGGDIVVLEVGRFLFGLGKNFAGRRREVQLGGLSLDAGLAVEPFGKFGKEGIGRNADPFDERGNDTPFLGKQCVQKMLGFHLGMVASLGHRCGFLDGIACLYGTFFEVHGTNISKKRKTVQFFRTC